MKKTLLIAAGATVAFGASAQYNCDPSNTNVINSGVESIEYITLADASVAQFEKAGAKVLYIGPSPEEGRNLWYWENTFVPGDESYPRVDMEEGGYVSVVVSTVGWSGAGFAIDAPGVNLSNLNDETHFHLAYMTPTGNGPASIGFTLLDKTENGSVPAHFAVGTAYNDNGAIWPTIGAAVNDEWQGIDITLGDLKKIWPQFSPANLNAWQGNVMAWLGGGVAGQSMAFDAIYFYNLKDESGVADVTADATSFVVTDNTVSVMGGNGIQLYNIAGQLVKSTNGTTVGINNLGTGIYVAKSGNKTQKIVVR
ncbi:MAG: T9SS type A sorting domain-containing protein [Muribaculum sp.]|nr:T9SS type A sorting domain-containing protein [Muribaculum sp.]